jgi:hypothetical protein
MQNANEILFRCSSLGHLMTEPKGKTHYFIGEQEITEKQYNAMVFDFVKSNDITALNLLKTETKKAAKDELSDTVITHLIDVFCAEMYNRHTEINGKQLEKGNDVEEDSITTVSLVTKKYFKKNESHLSNAYIKGTPDLFLGEKIYSAELVRDTKSSWDLYTFQRAINKPISKMNLWQIKGYMALAGAKIGFVDYCLNNTPYHIVEGELRRESYKHLNADTPAWIELQIIANHVYDLETLNEYRQQRGIHHLDDNAMIVYDSFVEIPLPKRHHAFEVSHVDQDIEALYKRIEQCRNWMNKHLFKI